MKGRRVAALAAAAWLASLVPATAGTPSGEKLAGAVAEANRKAGRAKPLLLDVSLRTGEASATGTLVTHPTGLARLELRGADGLERHLLQWSQYAASRDGEILAAPLPVLPPLFLLQADSGPSLRAALASFGVAASETGLGLADDRDCYVIGGRGRIDPVEGQGRAAAAQRAGAPVELGQAERSAGPREAGDAGSHVPSLWVELGSFEIVAVDRADGVRYRFGPAGTFDGVRIPRWIEISAPGEPPARLEIQRVAKASAPAAAFGMGWLSGSP